MMRLYKLLLRLYPASFRNEYGEEMRALFERRRQQASGVGIPALWLATTGEVIANALAVHLDILKQDLSYVGRTLRRAPAFAATAVLIVALGIGATTAAFSVTDFVLIRPLPFPEPDRLVRVAEKTPGYSYMEFSAPNYRDWKAAAKSFESMGVYRSAAATIARDIVSMVLRRCIMLALAGVIPGIFLAYAAGVSMQALLAGVKPADALTLASVVGLSVVMTVLGSLAPTLRALRVDPITALRAD